MVLRSGVARSAVALPLLFAAAVLAMGLCAMAYDFEAAFQYDTDEGLNLMKGMLVARGHALYSEIWSDQPPVLSYLLAAWFKVFGPSVLAGRCLVLLLSAVLVWALHETVRALDDGMTALLTALLLIASTYFIGLSFAVMVGLPALAIGTMGLYLAVRYHQTQRLHWLILSAGAMAVSLQTKLFVIALIPAIAALLWMPVGGSGDEGAQPSRARRLRPLLVWLAGLIIASVLLVLICHVDMGQLLRPHAKARSEAGKWAKPALLYLLRRDVHLLVLAGVAAALLPARWRSGGRERLAALVPLLWLGTGTLLLQAHRPLWYHHVLLLSIPACWASAQVLRPLVEHFHRWRAGAAGAWREVGAGAFSIPAVIALLVVCGIWSFRLAVESRRLFVYRVPVYAQEARTGKTMVAQIQRRREQTRWVFADRPIYPFYLGLPVPPELAVASTKRRSAGEMSDEYVVGVLDRYRPEQVVLNRIRFGPQVLAYLQREYVQVDPGAPAAYFVLRSLAEGKPDSLAGRPDASSAVRP